jgi:hypothetical protein
MRFAKLLPVQRLVPDNHRSTRTQVLIPKPTKQQTHENPN